MSGAQVVDSLYYEAQCGIQDPSYGYCGIGFDQFVGLLVQFNTSNF